MSLTNKHVYWALCFGVCVTALRALVHGSLPPMVTLLVQLTVALSVGLIFSLPILRLKGVIRTAAVLVVVLVYAAAYQYEAHFGLLPDARVLFYAGELTHLLPSLLEFLNVGLVVLLLVSSGLLAVLPEWRIGDRDMPPTIIGLATLAIILTHMQGLPVPMQGPSKTADPLVWFVMQSLPAADAPVNGATVTEEDYAHFLSLHGLAVDSIDPAYPICTKKSDNREKNTASVTFLILESVGKSEMQVMPNLQRIARENTYFSNFMSVGTKSVQALPALFSGLPPNPHGNYLWRSPAVNVESMLPGLAEDGYASAFFHGSDLSFEGQRAYLERAGFAATIELGDLDSPVYGWGYDDAAMFRELRRWIEQREKSPFIAALATLSSHHPFALPADWDGGYTVEDRVLDAPFEFELSLRYLDEQIGWFYDWYMARGQLLVIVTDHGPIEPDAEGIFNVPLIIAGPGLKAETRQQLAMTFDVPNTVLGLLGRPAMKCSPGLDLLDRESPTRIGYSVAGNSLESIYFHNGQQKLVFDRFNGAFYEIGKMRSERREILPEQVPAETLDVFQSITRVHHQLMTNNNYAPAARTNESVPLETLRTPLVVAHRGNIHGSDPKNENTITAIEAAIAAGVEWIEIDVRPDREGEPFLFHDPVVVLDGERVQLEDLTINQIREIPAMEAVPTLEEILNRYAGTVNFAVEVKAANHVARLFTYTHRVRQLVNNRVPGRQVIVDSFQEAAVRSIVRGCDCDVAIDHPFRQPVDDHAMDEYVMLGYKWLYVEQTVFTEDLLKRAHARGLRVMVYPVNNQAWLTQHVSSVGSVLVIPAL